jgi:serine/threonine-protein kinase
LDLQPGSAFASYRIVALLGRGGMGAVYQAHEPVLDRHVALKVLSNELLDDPSFAGRFRQEVRLAAKLEHPHIVPVLAHGIEEGQPWMAMRLMAGGSLARRLKDGPLAPRDAVAILGAVARALDHAHDGGVVHRDVKPANVLLDGEGRAYLADFGLAKVLGSTSVATATGLVHGTPSYMAPEQALGAKVDRAADVYALGVVAFECFTGRLPFTGATPMAIVMKHVHEPVPEAAPDEVAPPVNAVLRRCLAKTPAERWPSAGVFAAALGEAVAAAPALPTVCLPTLDLPVERTTDRMAVADTPPPPSTAEVTAPAVPGPRSGRPRPVASTSLGRNLMWMGVGGLGALVAIGLGGWLLLRGPQEPSPPDVSEGPAATEPAASPSPSATPAPPVPSVRPSPARVRPRPKPTAEAATPPPAEPYAEVAVTIVPTAPDEPEGPGAGLPSGRRVRLFCEARLEPLRFAKADDQDVGDSLGDLKKALVEHGVVELVDAPDAADAVVQVLERGRQPAVVGLRKVRVKVTAGTEAAEFIGQSFKSWNTWTGAANDAAKKVEAWVAARTGGRSGGETEK